VSGEDECVKAADIYQCGREKAPSVTSAIQSGLTNNVAPPTVAVRFKLLLAGLSKKVDFGGSKSRLSSFKVNF